MTVPNQFANVTTSIPLSQLDANFNTPITLGNTAIQLGNTVTTLNNMTLANVTVTSGNVTITNVTVTTANVTTANIATAVITTANVTTANITTGNVSGNITFTGTGNRITGDFSNTTLANRVMFQTSTANSATVVSAIPNGTSVSAQIQLFNNSDPTNAGRLQFAVGSTEAQIFSSISGTGTYLPMTFYTGGSERMRVDTAGNLGLGVTPSAWGSGWKALQFGGNPAISGSNVILLGNAYFNGTNFIYTTTNFASRYDSNFNGGGQHAWFTAPSGTAGNAITFTQAMTLNASGGLGVGETSIATDTRLHLKHTTDNCIAKIQSTFGAELQLINGGGSELSVINATGNNVLSLRTGSTERARITSGGSLLVGVTSGLGKVVIANADGANAPTTVTAANSYLHIGSGDFGPAGNGKFMVAFGYTGTSYTNAPAYIGFEETTGVGGTKGYLSFYTRDVTTDTAPTERARITSAGGFTCAGIYNTTVGATNRDVFVDNGGVVGYVSSLRASKTNIQDLTDTSWLHQLNLVTFNYRKKDEEGNYTEETDGDIQYGMIAEDVEQVRPDLCFYDEVDGEQELRGIQYSKLVPVMLKEIQKLRAELNALKGNA